MLAFRIGRIETNEISTAVHRADQKFVLSHVPQFPSGPNPARRFVMSRKICASSLWRPPESQLLLKSLSGQGRSVSSLKV